MKNYLQQRFLRNNHPKYHKYMDEWISGVTPDRCDTLPKRKRESNRM